MRSVLSLWILECYRIIKRYTYARIVPTMKRKSAKRRTDLRPMMCENDAQVGWKTVEQRRKHVPHQKAWIAVVPFKSVAIV